MESYSRASQGAALGDPNLAPKQDTLMIILARIEKLVDMACEQEGRFHAVKERIGGSTVEATQNPKPQQQIATHAIFAATRVEQELSLHLDRMAALASNMERMV